MAEHSVGVSFLRSLTSHRTRRDVCPKMAAVDTARVEAATQVLSENIQADTGPSWLNSAQTGVCLCLRGRGGQHEYVGVKDPLSSAAHFNIFIQQKTF